jgi:hypothetical protein
MMLLGFVPAMVVGVLVVYERRTHGAEGQGTEDDMAAEVGTYDEATSAENNNKLEVDVEQEETE